MASPCTRQLTLLPRTDQRQYCTSHLHSTPYIALLYTSDHFNFSCASNSLMKSVKALSVWLSSPYSKAALLASALPLPYYGDKDNIFNENCMW